MNKSNIVEKELRPMNGILALLLVWQSFKLYELSYNFFVLAFSIPAWIKQIPVAEKFF